MDYIEVNNLKKYYGTKRGVESISMSVRKGEIMGFVGPNGAGKTTVIRILLGLLERDSGSAKINGIETHFDQYDVNKAIGYLPSEPAFFNEYYVKDILKFFKHMNHSDQNYIDELVTYFELDVTKRVKELSLGNKKKVALVVTLMKRAPLLILDEPTTGLDPLLQKKFLDLLLKEKERGTTILLSSHVLSEVEKVCDRVTLIKEGQILFSEEMKTIKEKMYVKVTLNPMIHLSLPGLEVVNKPNGAFYMYRGDIQSLLVKLSKYPLKDLLIEKPHLEELFMDYYGE